MARVLGILQLRSNLTISPGSTSRFSLACMLGKEHDSDDIHQPSIRQLSIILQGMSP